MIRSFVVFACLVLGVACNGACGAVGAVAGAAIVDCVHDHPQEIASLVLELRPLLQLESPDFAKLESKAVDAGRVIGGCALARVVDDYLHRPKTAGAALADLDMRSVRARLMLEDYRGRYAGGATFRTDTGDI